MGVPGLTTFIDQNPSLLSDHKLYNCRIIIDGNNLYHFLYYYFAVKHEFGGDYDDYARSVRYFFTVLQSCKVEPYVVFDGGYDANNKKLQTSLKRAKERIHLAHFLSFGQRAKVLPLLAYETVRHVLDEMGVAHVSCDFEADDQIAALANHWCCPVMTNDSDFFIYDLKAGVVLLDYLNLHVKSWSHDPAEKFLNVQMFHFDTFHGLFKDMDRRMFPLFATLMANDYVDSKALEPFFATVHLPKTASKRFFTPERHKRISGLLLWLESAHDFDYAFERILQHFKEDQRKCIKLCIEKSLETYLRLETKLHLYFEEGDVHVRTRSKLKTFEGNALPYWFVEKARASELPPFILDTIVLHRVILLSQIETMNEASAYGVSLPLRQIIYGILVSLDAGLESLESKKEHIKAKSIVEYNREQKNLKKFDILPHFETKSGVQVPYLQRIPHMPSEEKEKFILEALALDPRPLHSVHLEMKLFMAAVMFWCQNAVPCVNQLHVAALLVSYLKLSVVDVCFKMNDVAETAMDAEETNVKKEGTVTHECCVGKDLDQKVISQDVAHENVSLKDVTQEDNAQKDLAQGNVEMTSIEGVDQKNSSGSLAAATENIPLDVYHVKRNCKKTDIEKVHKKLQKFTEAPRHSKSLPYDGKTVHAFSQFQACLRDIMALNQLLLCPWPNPDPAYIYNGTVIYNVHRELELRVNPPLYIEELLIRDSVLAAVFTVLYDKLTQNWPKATATEVQSKRRKNVKKREKKKRRGRSPVKEERDTKDNEDQDDRPLSDVLSEFQLNNRFGDLLLE